jgi:hypothetical protein
MTALVGRLARSDASTRLNVVPDIAADRPGLYRYSGHRRTNRYVGGTTDR